MTDSPPGTATGGSMFATSNSKAAVQSRAARDLVQPLINSGDSDILVEEDEDQLKLSAEFSPAAAAGRSYLIAEQLSLVPTDLHDLIPQLFLVIHCRHRSPAKGKFLASTPMSECVL